ncbi:Protein arginine N-methyltransferase 3 [Folsomia candida]|nr:Protein arginine N-methyltransferase 3 [Folsomia candida]
MNPTQADEVKSKMSWADRILNQDESDSASSSDYQSSKGDEYDDEVQHWEDLEEDFSNIPLCLFCQEHINVSDIYTHLKDDHNLDLLELQKKYKMDQESFIKMVNWVRHLGKSISLDKLFDETDQDLKLVVMRNVLFDYSTGKPSGVKPPWDDDKWLEPSMENDMFLTYWLDFDDKEDDPSLFENSASVATEAPQVSPVVMDLLVKDESDGALGSDLRRSFRIKTTTPEIEQAEACAKDVRDLEAKLQTLQIKNQKMKEVMSRIAGDGNSKEDKSPVTMRPCDDNGDGKPSSHDEEYFESYDGIDIHAEMLKDHPRTLAYKRAILNNKKDFFGKRVLDLGCGTGILSMFCVDAGAERVCAVDISKIIFDAMDICYENNKEEHITFFHKKLEDIGEDEIAKVDILISEFMGYFLLFEDDYQNNIGTWNNMHGYKMSVLKRKALLEACVKSMEPCAIASEEVPIKKLDLHTCKNRDLIIDDTFQLKITRTCSLTAICGYFSVGFNDGKQYKEVLSTSPNAPLTHWKQTVFYLPERMNVSEGDVVPIEFRCTPHPECDRWLKVVMKIGRYSCTFEMK